MFNKKLATLLIGLGGGLSFATTALAAPTNTFCVRYCTAERTICLQNGGTKMECLDDYRICMARCNGTPIP